jgi:hypothetical protein
MKPIFKAIAWYAWNMTFGLGPFYIFVFLYEAIDDPFLTSIIRSEITHLLRDLLIAFFCVSMMGSLSLDFLFSKFRYPYYAYFLAGAIPSWIFGVVSINYTVFILNKLTYPDAYFLFLQQVALLGVSGVFCIFVKWDLLKREKEFTTKNRIYV